MKQGFKFRFKNLSVRTKITLYGIAGIIVIYLAVMVVVNRNFEKLYSEKVHTMSQQAAEQSAMVMDAELQSIINLVHYSLVSDEIQSILKMDSGQDDLYIRMELYIQPVLTQIKLQNPCIDSVAVFIGNSWIYDYNYRPDYDLEEVYEKAVDFGLTYWSRETYVNKSTGRRVLPLLLQMPTSGKYIVPAPYMLVNLDMDKLVEGSRSPKSDIFGCIQVKSGNSIIYENSKKQENLSDRRIYTKKQMDINDWEVVYVQDADVLYQDLYTTRGQIMAVTLIILVTCIFSAVKISNTMTHPLKQLITLTHKLENQDFSEQFEGTSNDEIGQLGQSFNEMCSQLKYYIAKLEEEKQQVKINEHLKRKAELKALQEQINPHFLYNTLDIIYWYSLGGQKEEVSRTVIALSNMLRIALAKGNECIPVSQEVQHLKSYLTIEKIVFGDKFDYTIEVDPEAEKLLITKILLQPIAENSINHGFMNMESGGKLNVSLKIREENLVICVADNGCGFSETMKNKQNSRSSGYALKNIQMRLKLHYGEDVVPVIESKAYERTSVTIKIPLGRLKNT